MARTKKLPHRAKGRSGASSGLTHPMVAGRIGITQATCVQWDCASQPRKATLEKLAAGLEDVSRSQLQTHRLQRQPSLDNRR